MHPEKGIKWRPFCGLEPIILPAHVQSQQSQKIIANVLGCSLTTFYLKSAIFVESYHKISNFQLGTISNCQKIHLKTYPRDGYMFHFYNF